MTSHNMISENDPNELVKRLQPQLTRSASEVRPVVVMTCGIAGSGKTTLAKKILEHHPNFVGLSIDEIIASRHGLYGIDYAPDEYADYQEEADRIFKETLKERLVSDKDDVILDRSFYAKEDRDEFKAMVEEVGARWVLVYLKVPEAVLWQRIGRRRLMKIDANSALEISKELFEQYVRGFEHPDGEGEIVMEHTG